MIISREKPGDYGEVYDIVEVNDGGIVIEKDGKKQIMNLDYVVKICKYPQNKKETRFFELKIKRNYVFFTVILA